MAKAPGETFVASEGFTREAGVTDAAPKQVRCVIVTPERAVLDTKAEFVVLPMIDGELGVQPQHCALVGRLGKGELRLTVGNEVKKMRIEGGFAQIRANVVTVLTSRILSD